MIALFTDLSPAVGVDVGATLAKVAIHDGSATRFELMPSGDLGPLAARLDELAPPQIGLTGGGATRLDPLLDSDTAHVDEFTAWSAGARRLLRTRGAAPEEFLMASVGTGTSVLKVEPGATTRVGGTALGGGTLMGLGAALLGERNFERVVELASQGDRRNVDLLVGDIYADPAFELPAEMNAASFGKLARNRRGHTDEPHDLASALMGMLGENVALLCCALGAAHAVRHIVFGGTTLRANPQLANILRDVCLPRGFEAIVLERGEFVGAVGALDCAAHAAE